MQVFTPNRKIYQSNELKSWAWTVAFVLFLYFGVRSFFPISQDSLFVGVAVAFLLKLGNTLTQYHVETIQLDKESDKLNLVLSSVMSGQKYKTYDLRQITTELTENKTLLTGFKPSLALKIHITEKGSFQINSRYGFTTDTLTAVNNAVKVLNNELI
jgi:hypothetical protein